MCRVVSVWECGRTGCRAAACLGERTASLLTTPIRQAGSPAAESAKLPTSDSAAFSHTDDERTLLMRRCLALPRHFRHTAGRQCKRHAPACALSLEAFAVRTVLVSLLPHLFPEAKSFRPAEARAPKAERIGSGCWHPEFRSQRSSVALVPS
jgi:hypothetical protein